MINSTPATITASDLSAAPASTATARLVQGPPKITVSVKPGKLQANGQSTAKVTVRLAGVQGEPVSQPWGLREFRVLDLEDNELRFGQPFE